ncbi:MAG: hypothetical protein IPK67_18325 [Planctomycetes bacterium]|nr:hypothetical protein [Planctomycetota bacterium]
MVHALAAASQDAAIDALAIRSVAPGQQGTAQRMHAVRHAVFRGALDLPGADLAGAILGRRLAWVLALSASLGIAALALALGTSWSPQARLDSTPLGRWRNPGIAPAPARDLAGLLFAATPRVLGLLRRWAP